MLDGSSFSASEIGLGLTGSASDSVVAGLSIVDFPNDAISTDADRITIADNHLGVLPSGTVAPGQGSENIAFFGGTGTVIERNLIGGATNANIAISGGANAYVIRANTIGTDPSGTLDFGGAQAIWTDASGDGTLGGPDPVDGNVFANSTWINVQIDAGSGSLSIVGNDIYGGASLGIDLLGNGVTPNDPLDGDSGANDLRNFPEPTSAIESGGTADVTFDLDVPVGTYRIDAFANPGGIDASGNGEGEDFVGHALIAHPGGGAASFTIQVPASPGDELTLTATDVNGSGTYGSTSEFSVPVTVTSATGPPIADAGGAYNIAEGDSVALDGSGSIDPQGDPLTFQWDLDNDGTYGDVTGETPTVTWATLQTWGIDDDGTHTIGLRVTDGVDSDTTTTTILVANTEPTVTVTGAGAAAVGEPLTVTIDATDPGADTVTGYAIHWGDGTVESVIGGLPTTDTHTYTVAALRQVVVQVTDEDGDWITADLIVPSAYATDHIGRYDIETGAQRFQFDTASPIDSSYSASIGPDGLLYAGGWSSTSVERYDPTTGSWLGTFVAAGTGGLASVNALWWTPEGDLLVGDWTANTMRRYDGTTGAFIDNFIAGSGLSGPGQPDMDDSGRLYIPSYTGDQVHRFDATTGAFIDVFVSAASGGLDNPEAVVVAPSGELLVTSSNTDEVKRYDATTGAYLGNLIAAASGGVDWPSGMLIAPDGDLIVGSSNTDELKRYVGSTGAYVADVITSGTGGLDGPFYATFVPDLLVSVSVPLVVNSTDDDVDVSIGDGSCNTGQLNAAGVTECTLRAAIAEANADANTTYITFDIPVADGGHSGGVWTINTSSALPTITTSTVLDASTQTGYSTPVVAIDGSGQGAGDGLLVHGDDVTIRGFALHSSPDEGIDVHSTADRVTIADNHIGTNATGTVAMGNGDVGLELGGADAVVSGNLISGNNRDGVMIRENAHRSRVVGNRIGTDVTGNAALGNGQEGIELMDGQDDVILGEPGNGNVISGNGYAGINGWGNTPSRTIVQANKIGVGADGTTSVPNGTARDEGGVTVRTTGQDWLIGGTGAGEGNVIANNVGDGVQLVNVNGAADDIAVLGNSIYANTDLGIDIDNNGVTLNDVLDADPGINDLLNYPVITAASVAGGTVTVDFDLDVPAGDYRIEAFTNPSGADATGHGEGQVFGNGTTITHTGSGSESFQITYVGSARDAVTLSTTEDLGGGSYGSTSEFSAAFTVPCTTSDTDADGLYDCWEELYGDTDGDTLANENDADDDDDGVPTAGENADPNGDGDPRDALDSDRDGQPDWLDTEAGVSTTPVADEQKVSSASGSLTGPLADDDRFGEDVAPIGDIDGDGVNDIVVGARNDDDGGSDRGAAYVLFLNTNGTVKAEQKISDTQGGFAATLDNSDYFGRSVAGIGDIDGDGTPDIAVGANGDDDGGSDRGAVYVLFLNTNGTVKAEQKISDTQGNLTTPLDDSDFFGLSIAGIGDLDGDGTNDIAVTADSDDDGGSDRGAAYVLFLDPDGTVNAEQKISDTQGNLTTPLGDWDYFGRSIAGVGDVDGDGTPDIAVGSGSDDDGGANRGAVYVLFLNTNGTVKSEQKISDTQGNLTTTLDDSDTFGSSLAGIGDIDGDGTPDIAVGAIRDDDGGTDRGAVYVLTLTSSGTVKSEQKLSDTAGGLSAALDDTDWFGDSVSGIGDLDGDGAVDLAVGVPLDDDGGGARGAVYILDLSAGCGPDSDADGLLDCWETQYGDTDGDTTPNHLDPDDDGDGTPTASENADPNGDGDPRDALDADRDGQPDWLDAPLTAGSLGTVDSEVEITTGSGGLTATLGGSDSFGAAVTSIGDLDGDDIPELIATAPGDDDTNGGSGAAYVLFLNADGTVRSEQKISNLEGSLTMTWEVGDGYGDSVAGIGDIDGDGVPDLAVGAYDDDDGGASRGGVAILFMNADGTVKAEQLISHSEGNGPTLGQYDYFGAVTNLGDLDDDGVNDIAVGAYGDDDLASAGAVYILFLNTDGTAKTIQKISPTVGGFSGPLATSDQFGRDVAGLGDVDGDGNPDLAVGARYTDDGGSNRGAVWVLFLNADGTVKGEQKISSITGGLATDLDNSDYFGESVAGIGDVDLDGTPDLAVGATADDDGASSSNRGAIHILFLNPDGTVGRNAKISDTAGGLTAALADTDYFGSSVTGLGDIDGDGTADLAVGVEYRDAGGFNEGAVFVLLTATDLPSTTVVVNSTGDASDASPGDGTCETTTPGECTLRAAIEEANASTAVDVIEFAIPTSDPGYTAGPDAFTFTPASVYPNITERVTIDGTTQAEYVDQPVIVIDGSGTGTSSVVGIHLDAGSDASVIRALNINSYDDFGMRISDSGHHTITGMVLGLERDGTTAAGNRYGIYADTAMYVTVGGTGANEGNVIASGDWGLSWFNDSIRGTFVGNYIGTDVTGLLDRGLRFDGLFIVNSSSYAQVGGPTAAHANVVAGNGDDGIYVGSGTMVAPVVEGNLVGVGADGTTPIPNDGDGIEFGWGSGGSIIDNVVGPSGEAGIEIQSHDGAVVQGNVVGTDAGQTETFTLGGAGIELGSNVDEADIGGLGAGEANVITNATGAGIAVLATAGTDNQVQGNSIAGNGGLGIDLNDDGVTANDTDDLDAGPNDLVNFPVIVLADESSPGTLTVDYLLDGPAGTYDVHFYTNPAGADASGYGEGEVYVGSHAVVKGSTGLTGHTASFAGSAGDLLSATASLRNSPLSSTSEFSETVTATTTTIVVNSTGTGSDASPGDEVCDTGGTNSTGHPECTLLAALQEANASATIDTVDFHIPVTDTGHSGGVWTITPTGTFPNLTSAVDLDARTQPGWSGTPVVEIDGSSTSATLGIHAQLGVGTTIAGFSIGDYTRPIAIQDAGAVVQGNWVGVRADGVSTWAVAPENGVRIINSAHDAVVGGSAVGEPNVIVDATAAAIFLWSSDRAVIQGNTIGRLPDGTTAQPNAVGIRLDGFSDSATIGGTGAGEANLIADNTGDAIEVVTSPGSHVLGNTIVDNGGLAIDLIGGTEDGFGVTANDVGDADTGANDLLNHPVPTLALAAGSTVTVDFDLDVPAGDYRVEIFTNPSGADASGYGEAEAFEVATTITHTGSGSESFQVSYTGASGDVVTLSTTEDLGGGSYGSTSELSAAYTVAVDTTATVNSTGDAGDASAGDGVCDTGSTNSEGDPECTLRAAIEEANAGPVAEIAFAIPASDSGHVAGSPTHWVIEPVSAPLPAITTALTIDATTQSGWVDQPIVVLDGTTRAGASATDDALELQAASSAVSGLAIIDWPDDGIVVSADAVTVAGNWFGIAADGTRAPIGSADVLVDAGAGALIGGTGAADANRFAGTGSHGGVRLDSTASGTRVEGNVFGVLPDGVTSTTPGSSLLTTSGAATGIVVHDNRFTYSPAGISTLGLFSSGTGEFTANVLGVDELGGDVVLGDNGFWVAGTGLVTIGGADPGDGNTIRNATRGGIVTRYDTSRSTILGNSITRSGGLGIQLGFPDGIPQANDAGDADTGPNDYLNFPVITAATPSGTDVDIDFDLDVPAGDYRIEFFSNPSGADPSGHGEAEIYLGAVVVTHTGSGDESFSHTVTGPALDLSATATEDLGGGIFGSTSELAASFAVPGQDTATVNSTGDASDATPGDGDCNTGGDVSGEPECTLRAAIEEANASPVVDTIEFAIPTSDAGHSAGVWTISPTSGPFVDLTDPVTIDGTTQSGWTADPVIGLDGTGYAATPNDDDDGLELVADDSTVAGLAIYGFADEQIKVGADRVTVRSSWLGLDPTGTVVSALTTTTTPHAFQVSGDDFTFGGPTDADGNVVSSEADDAVITGTSTGGLIENNHFGVAADGTTALTNPGTDYVLRLRSTSSTTVRNNQFGNLPAGAIRVDGSATAIVVGNLFGTDATLTVSLPISDALQVREDATVRFGGTGIGDANTVRNATADAIDHRSGSTGALTVLGNSIVGSGGLAIDLDQDGVTANDAGDVDTGPNGLLNHPQVRHAGAFLGTVTVDIELDVPAGDYRIEIFTNPSGADPSGHGEAETFEDATTVTHTGSGVETFSVTYSGAVGDVIALTATEDLGGGTHGSTSELSETFTVTDATVATVNSTADTGDATPGDGRCDTGALNGDGDAECTLRAAIEEANASAAVTTIEFAVPTSDSGNVSGDVTIAPTSALPVLTSAVTIDATTQTGWSAVTGPVVLLDGGSAGASTHGMEIQASATTIRGLAIGGFTDTGVRTQSSATGLTLQQNWIGLDLDGIANPNANGLWLTAGGSGATVGGAGLGNVISGNTGVGITVADDATIQGNIIGLDPTGTAAVANGSHGIQVTGGSGAVTIGGLADLANTISGNGDIGVRLAAEATVAGNQIGVSRNGSTLLGNGSDNVRVVSGGDDSVIGSPGLGNTIRDATDRGINVLAGVTGVTIESNTVTDNGATGIANSGATVLGNATADNGGLGIDRSDDGPTANDAGDLDGIPNTPVIGRVQRVGGDLVIDLELDTTAGDHRIEVFGNSTADPSGFGEGETFLGGATVTHTGSGAETFQVTVTSPATILTATSTRDLGGGTYANTSEHSPAVPSPDLVIVNSTADATDVSVGDGQCDTGATNAVGADECTLRAAIAEANDATTPVDTIWFDIPTADAGHTSGVWTFTPATGYPAITDTVTLDGTTQPGFVANTNPAPQPLNWTQVLVIDGAATPTGADALRVQADDVTISGLVIRDFLDAGAETAIEVDGDRAIITAVALGTDAAGVTAHSNGHGIVGSGDDLVVGGTDPADRVLIGRADTSGIALFGDNAVIEGNLIATSADSTTNLLVVGQAVAIAGGSNHRIADNVIGGANQGIDVAVGTTATIEDNFIGVDATLTNALGGSSAVFIAGTATVTGNVIGNWDEGLAIVGGDATVTGNGIGTDLTGTADLPNADFGILVRNSASTIIGGTSPGDANIIANSDGPGISVEANTTDPAIIGNSIFANGGLGIDHDEDGVTANDAGDLDGTPNAPVLINAVNDGGVTTLELLLDVAAGTYRIDVYENPTGADPSGYGEGQNHITSFDVTHPGGGSVSFVQPFGGTSGAVLSATASATGPLRSTSEFSNATTAVSEAAATLLDAGVRRSDAVRLGAAAADQAGVVGDAIDFPGGTSRLRGPALDITSGAVTMAASVHLDAAGAQHAVISKLDSSGDVVYELSVDGTTGEAVAVVRVGGAPATARGGTVGTGAWHDLAAVWDGAELVLYVDGSEADRVAATGVLATDPRTTMTVGNRSDLSRPFDGRVDHVTVRHDAVAATEIAAIERVVDDPAAFVTVGAEQTSTPGVWTVSGTQTRSGGFALEAPQTAGADAAAWAVATGIDEPGLVFESWWWMSTDSGVDLDAGTRAGLAPTDQYEAALTSPSGWELRSRAGVTESTDAAAAGTPATGTWVKVEIWTDQLGDSRILIDGVEVTGWTAQGSTLSSGSAGLRVGALPGGASWFVDDARARKLVTPEPVTTLSSLDRN